VKRPRGICPVCAQSTPIKKNGCLYQHFVIGVNTDCPGGFGRTLPLDADAGIMEASEQQGTEGDGDAGVLGARHWSSVARAAREGSGAAGRVVGAESGSAEPPATEPGSAAPAADADAGSGAVLALQRALSALRLGQLLPSEPGDQSAVLRVRLPGVALDFRYDFHRPQRGDTDAAGQ
jgi:hypothetical protein